MYAIRSVVPALLAIISFTACGEDTSARDLVTGPESTLAVSGAYTVQSVDGGALPAAVFRRGEDDYEVYVLKSGSFTINPGGTFAKTNQLTKLGEVAVVTEICAGTYIKDGSSLFFDEAVSGNTCGGTFFGTFNGSASITLREVGKTIVLQK